MNISFSSPARMPPMVPLDFGDCGHYTHCACPVKPQCLVLVLVTCTMALVNATVYCISDKKTILPWMIQAVDPPDATIRSFYHSNVSCHLSSYAENPRQLKETFVGSKKDALDKVDPDLLLKDVTAAFGHFVKYVVSNMDEDPERLTTSGWCKSCTHKRHQ